MVKLDNTSQAGFQGDEIFYFFTDIFRMAVKPPDVSAKKIAIRRCLHLLIPTIPVCRTTSTMIHPGRLVTRQRPNRLTLQIIYRHRHLR